MTDATNALTAARLLEMIDEGVTIVIANHMHAWEITAKVVKRWRAAGREILKQSRDGKHILMGSGRSYVRITGCSIKGYR